MAKRKIPDHLHKWIEARQRFGLSHTHIQMARELGMNPNKFGGLANRKRESWKVPLPEFIEYLFMKRFDKPRPDRVVSIEDMAGRIAAKKAVRRERRRKEREGAAPSRDSEKTPEFGPSNEELPRSAFRV